MNFEKGDVITLDGEVEYVVIDRINCEDKEYTILATNKKPLKILVCKVDNDNLTEIKDKVIIKKIISKMA